MRLDFVELRVRDVAASVAWYRDVTGLAVTMQELAFALLDAGGCRLALKAGEPSPGGALLAFEVADLDAEVARLGDRIQGELKSSAEGYRRARLHDPDGYEVVLFEWGPVVNPERRSAVCAEKSSGTTIP